MDDIIRSIRKTDVEKLLLKANSLHPNLCFTVEMEEHNEIPFLDMKLKRYLGECRPVGTKNRRILVCAYHLDLVLPLSIRETPWMV